MESHKHSSRDTPVYDALMATEGGEEAMSVPSANLAYRKWVLKKCSEDEDFKEHVVDACRRDVLYYFNVFCWTYDPRRTKDSREIPFVTYKEFQDDAIIAIRDAILNQHNLPIEKSRGMGASWMVLGVIDWLQRFQHKMSFDVVSRKEELVDDTERRDTLFWKLRYLEDNLPSFLALSKDRMKNKHMMKVNFETGSIVVGESTTPDMGRGGRNTAILLDEFDSMDKQNEVISAVRNNSNCLIFCSTPKSGAGEFFKKVDSAWKEGKPYLSLHWSKHPEMANMLYEVDKDSGRVTLIDEVGWKWWARQQFGHELEWDDLQQLADSDALGYDFIREVSGSTNPRVPQYRSQWYDNEWREYGKMLMAQECDIDYFQAGSAYFEIDVLQKLMDPDTGCTRKPLHTGELCCDTLTGELEGRPFVKDPNGSLKLWCNPDARGNHPRDRNYVMGVDISNGTGNSNSVIVVYDRKTNEKVAEYADSRIRPDPLGGLAVSLGKWFAGASNEAYLIWEHNGPGQEFSNKVIDLGYNNFFWRRNEQSIRKRHKRTDKPGWWSGTQEKKALLGNYRRALGEGTIINRSDEALRQCFHYIHKEKQIVHDEAVAALDPADAGDNHGDHVIADALCVRILDEVAREPLDPGPDAIPRNIPPECRYMRELHHKRKNRERNQGEEGWLWDAEERMEMMF